jgi:hypothetical protein
MRSLTVAFLVVCVLALLPPVVSAGCVTYDDYLHPLGASESREQFAGLWMIAGEMPQLYVVTSGGWFSVVDASDPAALDELGALDLDALPGGLVVQGEIAYLTLRPSRLQLVSVADPASPTPLGSVEIPSEVYGLAVSGSYAYVTAHRYDHDDHGVYVVDVSDPMAPVVVTWVNVGDYPRNVVIDGTYAYVLQYARLCVLDISNPITPTVVASVAVPGQPTYLAFRDGYVYVVCHQSDEDGGRWYADGLYIVNVTDPTHPWLEGSHAPEGDAPNMGIELWGHYALVGVPGLGIDFIDVTDPAAPVSHQLVGIQDTPTGFFATDDLLFATSTDCLMSYALRDGSTPAPVAVIPGTEGCWALAARGEYAYAGDANGRFHVIDMTNPEAPQVISSVPVGFDWISVVALTEDSDPPSYAYVSGLAENDAFAVIDVADPYHPQCVNTIGLAHYASDLEVEGNRLYVQAGHLGTRIYDISDPRAPRFINAISFTYSPQFLTADGTTLYVGRRNVSEHENLYIIDASDPNQPVFLGTSYVPELPYEIRVVGPLAYIADGDGGFLIMDVSDPAEPVALSRLRTVRRAMSVWIDGDLAYLTDQEDNSGLQVVDVSDPTAPFTIGYFRVNYAGALALIQGHALVASYRDPLTVAPLNCGSAWTPEGHDGDAAAVRLAWSANPCRDGSTLAVYLPHAGRLCLTLHDAQGRLVQRLYDGALESGDHAFRWDGRDAAGRPARNGVYFARLALPDVARSRALVRLR